MEHPCYKCGTSVEDGIAFCRQCNAPQIRVGGYEAVSEAGTLVEIESAPSVLLGDVTTIQWAHALPSTALAGLISALLMFMPLGAFGLGMIAAGVFAVIFYRRRSPATRLTPGMGARLGAVGGTLGFGISAIFTAIEVGVFHTGERLRANMLEAIQQSASRTSDPQTLQVFEYFKSPAGLALIMVIGLVMVFVAFLILASLGGATVAVLLRRKDPA